MKQVGLSELTVIIPTLSRPQFVLRQFEYWREMDARVVILDGASAPIAIPDGLRAPNVHYVHSGQKFNVRLATAAQYVETPYCVLLPDDEFMLPSGLRSAIQRLKSDPNIIGCVGRNLYFFVDQGRFLVRDAYREWLPFPRPSMSLSERLDVDLPPHKTHKAQFAILRSDAWQTMFESSYGKYFSCGYTYERLLNLQRTVLGHTEILEDVIWMRSMENPPISNESVPRVDGRDFVSWARNPDFGHEVAEYREIARLILLNGGLDDTEADEFEERFFVGGVARQATKEARNSRKLSYRLGMVALTKGPVVLKKMSKRILPPRLLRFTGWEGYSLDVMCESLRSRGTSFVRDELDRIEELSLRLDQEVRWSPTGQHG